MLKAFKSHIENKLPFIKSAPIALAVSGGVDSMVLLDLCCKLKLNCVVLHCNFQLRAGDSVEDQRFIQEKAQGYGIPMHSVSFDTKSYAQTAKLSIQMAARELRYNWFLKQKQELDFSYLLTAHHADDNFETFLINLSRSTGLKGLTGIPQVNDYIVRPLLPFSRLQIYQYAKEHNIAWREDSSNAETKYIRNKFRHHIIPIFKEVQPDFLENFNTTLSYLNQSKRLIDSLVEEKRLELFTEKDNHTQILISKLKKLQPLEAYLYELFGPYGFKNIDELEQLLDTLSGKQLISDTHRLIRDREHLLLTPLKASTNEYHIKIEEHQNKLDYPIALSIDPVKSITQVSKNQVLLDKEKLKFPLILRKRENADYFYPFGMQGKKKLSKYFKDEKFSLIEKENQWLLCNNDNEIIWIVGHRADDRFRITEKTTQILKITSFHA